MRPGHERLFSRLRAARWLRPTLTGLLILVLGVLYLVVDSFRDEVNRAIRVLTSGDVEAVRDYILSYGAWAPVVSAALMVLQALLTFVPSFILAFANGLAFGAFWGGMLSLVSAAVAAAISFSIPAALQRPARQALDRSLHDLDQFVRSGRVGAFRAGGVRCRAFEVVHVVHFRTLYH